MLGAESGGRAGAFEYTSALPLALPAGGPPLPLPLPTRAEVLSYLRAAVRASGGSGRGDEARAAALQAVVLDPDDRQALDLMAEYHYEPWRSKWAALARHATSADVLY